MSEEVHTGTITLWLGTRGYGFIKDDVPSYKGVFLHARDLPNGMKDIAEGTKVSFKIGERNGKPWRVTFISSRNSFPILVAAFADVAIDSFSSAISLQ